MHAPKDIVMVHAAKEERVHISTEQASQYGLVHYISSRANSDCRWPRTFTALESTSGAVHLTGIFPPCVM